MKAKLIGSITSHHKTVGKFYRPTTSQHALTQSRRTSSKGLKQQIVTATTIQLKRSKSVGKIYSSNNGQKSQKKYQSGRLSYNNLINYEQMENKLSSYLNCTIRTNGRQKYNYLGEQYRQFSNERYGYQRKTFADLQTNDQIMFSKLPLERQFYGSDEAVLKENNFMNVVLSRESAQKKEFNKKGPLCKGSETKKGKENRIDYEPMMKNIESAKKDTHKLFAINHQEQKCELENKLRKIIDNYQNKNKQLSNQLHLLENKATNQKVQEKQQKAQKKEVQRKQEQSSQEEQPYNQQLLAQMVSKLVEFNMKAICFSIQCQQKQTLWRSIHQQIILDQKLRIAKLFINEQNISRVLESVNANRLKKIDSSALKTHPEEYDPFLIQKCSQLLANNLCKPSTSKWIADNFIKCFEQSQRHWIKYLSQQKMQCQIKSLVLQKQVVSLRKVEGISRQLNLRQFTRYLSTLFKSNLRNRNLYTIYSKIKGLPYVGRFIELLQQKTSKISEGKKSSLQK